jgi:endonuclease YncB( thermonuclease family)
VSFQPFSYRALPFRINWTKRGISPDQHDGDSLWLLFDKGDYQYTNANCRLFGINTPEMNDPDPAVRLKAVAAREHLAGLLGLKKACAAHDWVASNDASTRLCKICCEIERLTIVGPKNLCVKSEKLDKYGRPLVTIWTDPAAFGDNSKSANKAMIDAGHAIPFMGDLA